MPSEKSPLLAPSNASGSESSKYYFLNANTQAGTTEATRDGDGDPVIEGLPSGSTPEEFAPRVIGSPPPVRFPASSHCYYYYYYFLRRRREGNWGTRLVCTTHTIVCTVSYFYFQS